jgi:hypothetical protein
MLLKHMVKADLLGPLQLARTGRFSNRASEWLNMAWFNQRNPPTEPNSSLLTANRRVMVLSNLGCRMEEPTDSSPRSLNSSRRAEIRISPRLELRRWLVSHNSNLEPSNLNMERNQCRRGRMSRNWQLEWPVSASL